MFVFVFVYAPTSCRCHFRYKVDLRALTSCKVVVAIGNLEDRTSPRLSNEEISVPQAFIVQMPILMPMMVPNLNVQVLSQPISAPDTWTKMWNEPTNERQPFHQRVGWSTWSAEMQPPRNQRPDRWRMQRRRVPWMTLGQVSWHEPSVWWTFWPPKLESLSKLPKYFSIPTKIQVILGWFSWFWGCGTSSALQDEDSISELSIEWERANTLGSAHLPVERTAHALRPIHLLPFACSFCVMFSSVFIGAVKRPEITGCTSRHLTGHSSSLTPGCTSATGGLDQFEG